jgi:hypothetical protein
MGKFWVVFFLRFLLEKGADALILPEIQANEYMGRTFFFF